MNLKPPGIWRKWQRQKWREARITEVTYPPARGFGESEQAMGESRPNFLLYSLANIQQSQTKWCIKPLLGASGKKVYLHARKIQRDRAQLLNSIDYQETAVLPSELRKCGQVHAQAINPLD